MGPQNSSGRPAGNKTDRSSAGVVIGLVALVAALLVGVELSERDGVGKKAETPPRQSSAAKAESKRPKQVTTRAGAKAGSTRAQAAAWLSRLEQLLDPRGELIPATEANDAGTADPWQAWLLLRALGPSTPAPTRAAVQAMLEAPPEPPELLGSSARLALVAGLLAAKVEVPAGDLRGDAHEPSSSLALRIEVLSLTELMRPGSQRALLARTLQSGLEQLRRSVRAVTSSDERPEVAAVLEPLLLSQAIFRAAPLVGNQSQEQEVRRAFAALKQLRPQLDRAGAAEALMLHAAMTESVAAYVHVKRQESANEPDGLEERLRQSADALVAGLSLHAPALKADFASGYAITLSVRALRLSKAVL